MLILYFIFAATIIIPGIYKLSLCIEKRFFKDRIGLAELVAVWSFPVLLISAAVYDGAF